MGTNGSKHDMNYELLSLNQQTINLSILKENIENIYKALLLLEPEKNEKNLDKYLCLSCIFGAFLGDSMGSCCEFSLPCDTNHIHIFEYEEGIFRPGEVTDDSEMAMSAAFAYIDILNEDPSIIQDLIYYYFCIWRCSEPKDIGGATTSALDNWDENQSIIDTKFDAEFVRTNNWNSLANGFLMRISTFIVYYYYTNKKIIYDTINNFFNENKENNEIDDLSDSMILLYNDIFIESYKNVEITHPNYENGISSAVFTLMVLVGMVKKDAKKVYSIFDIISNSKKIIDCHEDKEVKNSVIIVQEKYKKIMEEINNPNFSVYKKMGYYIHGFKLSVYFLKKYPDMCENKDKDLYYKIMCEICDFGGDTDTNGAIVGTMIGPLIGYKNFKNDLFERFIKFIPDTRCQFTSAFMYVYVNYLEEKLYKENFDLNKEKKEDENTDNNKIFKYTAFHLIMKFLNKKITIKK